MTSWEPVSADDWLREIRDRLEREQPFLAFDLAKRAGERYPQDHRISLTAIYALLKGCSMPAAREALSEQLAAGAGLETGESRALLADIHEILWEHQRRDTDLRAALGLFRDLFSETGQLHHGISAATLALAAGDLALAQQLAETLLQQPADVPPSRDQLSCYGSASLLLGDFNRAATAFRQLAEDSGDYRPVVAALKRLQLLESLGLEVPADIRALLRPPAVVIFGGHPIDPPGSEQSLLPPAKVPALADAIRAELDRLRARIGYTGASCGADLLFAEALLERGGELHLILPCAETDFLAARVAYAGPAWVTRFEQALEKAATVTYATEERYLGHSELLRHANQMITGLGWMRAQLLSTEPYLLAAWDYRAQKQPGSATDFIDHWPDIKTLRLIDLDELPVTESGTVGAPREPEFASPKLPLREIHTMLFADVVGYSKLGEEYLPQLLDFLAAAHAQVSEVCNAPDLVESWGDAIYVVMSSARALLEYAFKLRSAFVDNDHSRYGLPIQLNIRIGLHAGPVFPGVHPFTGRAIYSGRQVNRAARIEPITMPGEVYASQEFVALLTAEEMAVRHELNFSGRSYRPWYQTNYLGVVEMPKKHGTQQVYHLLPAAV